jgi:hypothetical protein
MGHVLLVWEIYKKVEEGLTPCSRFWVAVGGAVRRRESVGEAGEAEAEAGEAEAGEAEAGEAEAGREGNQERRISSLPRV